MAHCPILSAAHGMVRTMTTRAVQKRGAADNRAGAAGVEEQMALKIVMDDMASGEVAAMYQWGEDAVIMVARDLPDDVRCAAVNDLLAHIKAQQIGPATLRRLLVA